jgi:hypothetical protein
MPLFPHDANHKGRLMSGAMVVLSFLSKPCLVHFHYLETNGRVTKTEITSAVDQ